MRECCANRGMKEEEEDLSSVSSEVVEPRPPSPPDPVPPAPSSPPVPSASSSTSVSSSLRPDKIALKRLICKSLPQPPNCTLTWSSPEINSFVDGLLSQSSFSVSLRDFAVSYVSRLIYDYQKEVADARLAGWCPPPPPPFLARKSGGHCTHPTGGPSFALNTKKTDEAQKTETVCLQLVAVF